MKETIFVFLRHAESEKNIIDITGGKGKKLTSRGIQQAEIVARELFDKYKTFECEVISSPILQVIETAEIVSKEFDIVPKISDELTPAHMGIINGLSQAEIKSEFPEIFNLFQKWRSCEIEAIDLAIPKMESPEDFWKRMKIFLDKNATGGIKFVVCTRSLMVFAYNLTHNHTPQKGGGYVHKKIEHCATIAFSYDESGVLPLEEKELCDK